MNRIKHVDCDLDQTRCLTWIKHGAMDLLENILSSDDDDLLDCDLCKRGLGGENLWCDETQQGYVGGEVVTSYACFECKSAGTQVCESCDGPSSDVDRAACAEKNFKPNTESSDCEGDA